MSSIDWIQFILLFVGVVLIGFMVYSAALFIPGIAKIHFSHARSDAAFWSISLSLITVTGWYMAKAFKPGELFNINPVWPGLLVSATKLFGLNPRAREAAL